jgi:hypothetical protein
MTETNVVGAASAGTIGKTIIEPKKSTATIKNDDVFTLFSLLLLTTKPLNLLAFKDYGNQFHNKRIVVKAGEFSS